MNRLFILLVLLQIPLFAKNNPILTNELIQHELSTTNLQIGKPFSVIYRIPDSISQILSIDSNIQASADMELVLTNGDTRSFQIDVISYSPTPHPMPSLLITAIYTNGFTNQFYTPSFQVNISNGITKEKELAFIDIEEPFFVFDWMWIMILLGVAGLITAIIYLKNYQQITTKKETKIIIDPFELMSSRIKVIKTQQLTLNEENYKEFFVSLSEAVREFLSHTLIPLALETPTRELLKTLKTLKIDEELFEIIQFIMRSTDRAKYAKQIFTEDRINEVVRSIEQLLTLIQKQHQEEKDNELRKS
ncbi:MAG: hypothetical protein ACRCTJ_07465 [Brevinema sp.]